MNKNVRQGKLLTKLQEMSFFKKNILFIAICFVLLVFSTIGYAALNQKLFISGDLALRAVKDIRISDLKLVETLSGGYEQYNSKYTADTITITSALAEDGSATTYQATITNYGTTDMEIASISSNSTTWFADCTIIGLAKGDEISAGTSKTFKITLKRKANIATTSYVAATLVEFKFQEAKVRYLAYNIGGNSIQNGTPSPSSASEIESVGVQSTNLIPFTYTSKTINGVTVTVNNDGSLTYNGTSTASSSYEIFSGEMPLIEGQKYYFSDCSVQLNGVSGNYMSNGYTAKSGDYISLIWIWNASGTTFNNVVKKPMLSNSAITSSSYERSGYKIPIKVSGKNLFNAPLWETSVTGNGITVEYLESEDCFLLNGTATSTNSVAGKYINIPSVPGTSYVLSAKYVSGSIDRTNGSGGKYAVAYFGNADTINTTNNWHSIHLQNQDVTGSVKVNNKNYITRFWFYVSQGVTFDNYKVKIQLEEGSTATDYVPYVEPKTYNIYLDEPLRKVGNYADSIDYANKRIIRNVKEISLSQQTAGKYTYNNLNGAIFTNVLDSNKNRATGMSNVEDRLGAYFSSTGHYMWLGVSNNAIYWVGILDYLGISDISEFNNWLKENEVKVDYILETPIEETIDLPEITVSSLYTNYKILTDVEPSNFTYELKVKN